jgi:hypothetical protein
VLPRTLPSPRPNVTPLTPCSLAATVELYYLSHAGQPLSREQLITALDTGAWPEANDMGSSSEAAGRQRWVRICEGWSLHDTLSRADFVIPGIPMLAAVARGTHYRDRFLATNKP